jgi:hypothetical protein
MTAGIEKLQEAWNGTEKNEFYDRIKKPICNREKKM